MNHKHIPLIVLLAAVSSAALARTKPPVETQPAQPNPVPAQPPADLKPWNTKYFVNPPLKCLQRYQRIEKFPIIAWDFHGAKRFHLPYDESYAATAKAAGFTVLVDADVMLEPCLKTGLKLIIPAFRVTPQHLEDRFFKPGAPGDHAAFLGLVMDDDCMGIDRQVRPTAAWLAGVRPHLISFVSQYPAGFTSNLPAIRLLAVMNYPFMRSGGGPDARRAFCGELDNERRFVNANQMAAWPIISGHSIPEYRFQVAAALAYGAQGTLYFAYTPHKGQWKLPECKPWHEGAAYIQNFAWQVLGRHTWGTRSLGVFHTANGNDVPKSALTPGPAHCVRAMDQALLAGALVVESRYVSDAKPVAPDYVLVVDKRADRLGDPPARDTWIELAPELPVVELLDRSSADPKALRRFYPGRRVPLKLIGGDSVLLRCNPPDVEALLGKEAFTLYVDIASRLAAAPAGEAKSLEALSPSVDKLKGLLSSAPCSPAQRESLLANLGQCIEWLRGPAGAAGTASK